MNADAMRPAFLLRPRSLLGDDVFLRRPDELCDEGLSPLFVSSLMLRDFSNTIFLRFRFFRLRILSLSSIMNRTFFEFSVSVGIEFVLSGDSSCCERERDS